MNRDFEDLGGRDPYEMLGVRPDAHLEEINRRHRRLLRETHPDVGGEHDEQAMLNLARDILRDPRRRQEYEERLLGPDVEELPEEDEAPFYEDPYDWTSGAGPPTVAQDPPEYVDYPPPAYTYHRTYRRRPTYVYYPPPVVVARRRWNTAAIVALSLSFCFPAGLILGIVALAEIHRTRERGAVLAGLSVVISGGLLLCVLAQLFAIGDLNHLPGPGISPAPSRTAP